MSNRILNDDSPGDDSARVGTKAPDFELEAENGTLWRLSDQLGKVVALLFYPKNETLVCTKQLCSVRDNWSEYVSTDAAIVGISPGSVEAHRSFSQSLALPIRLLADDGARVTEKYGAHWLFPTFFMRTIVIVDAKGFIREKRSMLRAFRPADRSVIASIYEARADFLSEKYNRMKINPNKND